MIDIRPITQHEARRVERFLEASAAANLTPLGERKCLALADGEPGLVFCRSESIVGVLQSADSGSVIEVIAQDREVFSALVHSYSSSFKDKLTIWSKSGQWDRPLEAMGYKAERTLYEMTMGLPVEYPISPSSISFSGFSHQHGPAWLELNNAAFAGHPEQSKWTLTDLEDRQRMSWWDPTGLRLAWDDQQLVGFCWTKVPRTGFGEIYVIGISPVAQGRGLGKALTAEGLRYLHEQRGVHTATLFVEQASARAVALYEGLGFEVVTADRAFSKV